MPLCAEDIYCTYQSKATHALEFYPSGCAIPQNNSYQITPFHLKQILFESDGLASLFIHGRAYYLNKKGTLLPVVIYDNWADNFSEGLVRVPINGKIAYYNKQFQEVIKPQYDYAWPFDNGYALVCIGCHTAPLSPNNRHEEHRPIVGGKWGYIDRFGNPVVPIIYPSENIYAQQPALLPSSPLKKQQSRISPLPQK